MIQSPCKLTYKDGFLVIRGDEVNLVHLSEIHSLIIDSTMTTVTGFLMCELMREKINVVFCDEKRNPIGSVHPCYGAYDSAGRVAEQTKWTATRKEFLWQSIVRQKIRHQAMLLRTVDPASADLVDGYAADVTSGDATNREGHAAKVYFNRIFGPAFTRGIKCDRNAALDYGYALLLSTFNKEITARGYLTQLGIHHRNAMNDFNLSSDLMEPFRALVDRIVLAQGERPFDKDYKILLLTILQEGVLYENQHMSTATAITKCVRNATEYLSGRIEWTEDMVIKIEDKANESHRHV